jgi:hypothetical protein
MTTPTCPPSFGFSDVVHRRDPFLFGAVYSRPIAASSVAIPSLPPPCFSCSPYAEDVVAAAQQRSLRPRQISRRSISAETDGELARVDLPWDIECSLS